MTNPYTAAMKRIEYDYVAFPDYYPPLPHYMKEGLRRHVEDGSPVGHFLTALLSNDLKEAIFRADDTNRAAIVTWAYWLRNECPQDAQGSPEAVKKWREAGGLKGLAAKWEKDENWQDRLIHDDITRKEKV